MGTSHEVRPDYTSLPEPVRLEDTVAAVPPEPFVDRTVGDPEQAFVLRHAG